MARTEEQDDQTLQQIKESRKKQKEIKDKSLIIVNTGNGKGKTTAAMGIVYRIVAHGWKAAVVQFMKNPDDFKYGEAKMAKQLDNLDLFTMGAGFTWDTKNRDLDIQTTLETWEKSKELILSNQYRLVLLDEINYVIDYGFLEEEVVVDFLQKKPSDLHVILTGRNAKQSIIDLADLVTEMVNIKHPYKDKGLLAQKGIEW